VQGLRTRAQFQAALAGTVQAKSAHFVLHFCRFDAPAARPLASAADAAGAFARGFVLEQPAMGAMVPKRWAKRAVTRNTIKRQIYHVSQLFENRLLAGAHLVRLRSAFDPAQFHSASSVQLKAAVRGELLTLFERAAQAVAAPAP